MKASEPFVAFGIPATLAPATLMRALADFNDPAEAFEYIKKNSGVSDDILAGWLNVNVKTFRNYRDGHTPTKPDMQEHLLLLMAFVRHGLEVFGASEVFQQWLLSDNYMLDNQKPSDLMNTNSGVRFLDDRLTNMEFGINA